MSLRGFAVAVGATGPDGADAGHEFAGYFRAFDRGEPSQLRSGDAVAASCCLLSGPRAHERARDGIRADAGLTLWFDGWLENAAEVALACGADVTADHGSIVLAAWRRWGEALGPHLAGEYSFVIWDERAKRLFALRDKVGVRPLFYSVTGGGIAVANLPGALASVPGVDAGVDAGYAAEFLCAEESSFNHTLITGVRRLPGGHQLSWQAERGVTVRRYWQPAAVVLRLDAQAAQTELSALLARVVTAATRDATFVGCDLSGGIDSSSVAVQLGRLVRAGERAAEATAALSLVYPGLPCDETPFIDAMATRLPYASMRFAPRYASVSECESATAMLRYPYFPFNATGALPIIDTVRARGGVLLSGEGGDELFEPVEHALRAALVQGRERAALRSYLAHHWAARGTRSLAGLTRYAIGPFAGQRLQNFVNRWRDRRRAQDGWPVDPEWARAVNLAGRVDRLLYPRNARTLAMGSALSGAWSPSFEWLFFAACVAGVESRHPLSSSSLMAFCNRLPLGLLDGQEARNRLLLRSAAGDDLPPLIAERTSKAEFTPATLPELLHRAETQLGAVGRLPSPEGGFGFRAKITGARHVWRLDAALSLELWLRQLPSSRRRGLGLRVF